MDRAGAEDERDAGRDQRPHDRPHARDAGARLGLVGALEDHQGELALAHLRGGDEREAVAGRADDEVVRRVGEQRVDEGGRVGAEPGGGEAGLEQRPPAVERADAERDRPGINAGDARAGQPESSAPRCLAPSSLAISYTPSTSRTASLVSNSRAMQVLWTFIFGPPIASAPRTFLPS